ncbi:MAG: tetratricopeptide repeat protein, partial [Gemmataceae bacterium]
AAQGQLDDSLRELEVLLRSSEIPARALIDMARLELQRQMNAPTPQWNNCQELLRLAEEANPRAVVEIPLLRAEMLLRQGKADLAKRELLSARDRCPDEVDLWGALIDCAVRRNRPEEARKLLAEAKERVGDKVGLRLARARLLETEGKLTPAELDQLAQSNPQFTEAEQSRLFSGLADACLRANLPRHARLLYARLAELPAYKNDLRLQLLMFDMALRDQDLASMDRILDTIKAIEKDSGIYHRYGLALKTLFRARTSTVATERAALIDQARADLDLVAKARPTWGSVCVARAELASLEANPDQAIFYLQQAMKNGETSPSVFRRLTSLLMQKGRTDEAQRLIRQMNHSLVQAKDMRDMAVSLAIRKGDVTRALEIARASIQDDSRDPNELVYMARILAANKKYDEAEKRLEEALRLDPTNANVHLARVQFLVETRRKSEVPAALAAIAQNVPEKQRPLLLAQCHELVSDFRQAMVYYAQAAEQGKDNRDILRAVANAHLNMGRFSAAEPLLRRLLSGAVPGVSSEEQAWAKRQLALVLAGGTDYRRFTEALSLVGLKLEVDGRLPEIEERNQPSDLLRAWARILASQPQKTFRDQAIRLFEALDRRGDLNPEDRFTLAMLYEAEGKSDRSQRNLRELTQPPLRTPRYLAQYAMSLLATRRDDEALTEVDRIVAQLTELESVREAGPNGFASVELRARLLEARGQADAARELVRQHVQRPGAKPEEIVLWVNTLSRQKRFDEAFDLCQQQWKKATCPPEVLGAIITSLLRVMTPTDAQLAQVETWLTQAVNSPKASPPLRMQLADVLDRRGKYAEAAQQWREVLKLDPNNFVAMNNLAWQIVTHGGDATEALLHIDKALAGMGRRADLLDTRGLVYLALKQPDKALTDFQAAAADGPTPTRLLHLAQAQHQLKDRAAAKASLQKAKEVGLELAKLHPTEQETARKLLLEYGL